MAIQDKNQTKRIFIAADIPENIREKIIAYSKNLTTLALDAKWTEQKQMHITLSFLGEISVTHLPALKELMIEIERSYPPIHLVTDTLGVFPSLRSPRILWLGFSGQIDIFTSLYQTIVEKLSLLDVAKEERAFQPHLTLARIRSPLSINKLQHYLTHQKDFLHEQFLITEITLYESTLTPRGPLYTVLHRGRLRVQENSSP